MKNLNLKQEIKWAIIAPVSSEFNRNYKSALKKAGFKEICGYGVFADHYNAANVASVKRLQENLEKLNDKFKSYKHKKGIFSFTISDAQFGLAGSDKATVLADKKGWVSYPLANGGLLPVTYNQMYAEGRIDLVGSQGGGVRYDGSKATSKVF